MDQQNFYKDGSLLMLELLKATFGNRFKEYFLGAPTLIPASAYPCVIVQTTDSQVSQKRSATGMDKLNETIQILFYESSINDDEASVNQDSTARRMYQYIQGRDPQTGFFADGTAMYALRTNLTLPNNAMPTQIDSDIAVQYDADVDNNNGTVFMIAQLTVNTESNIFIQARV